jgi:hypothetical protein
MRSQKKNLCFGRHVDFQIHLNGAGATGALIRARYTFLIEYFVPPQEKFHLSITDVSSRCKLFSSCDSSSHCCAAIRDKGRLNMLKILSCAVLYAS